jgi:hypothetical protein
MFAAATQLAKKDFGERAQIPSEPSAIRNPLTASFLSLKQCKTLRIMRRLFRPGIKKAGDSRIYAMPHVAAQRINEVAFLLSGGRGQILS